MLKTAAISKMPRNCIASKLMKRLTLFIFFILPRKVTDVFVTLSIISAINSVRQKSVLTDKETVERINIILNLRLSEQVLMFPEQTLNWYWSKELFDTPILVGLKHKTIGEVIADEKEFLKYKGTVLNKMFDTLPRSIQLKLGLYKPSSRTAIKHNITRAFMHA